MLGIKEKAGAVVMQGRGIKLTLDSTQEELKRAVKRVPQLKDMGFVIELTPAQIKEREAARVAGIEAKNKSKTKTLKNDSKKATGE